MFAKEIYLKAGEGSIKPIFHVKKWTKTRFGDGRNAVKLEKDDEIELEVPLASIDVNMIKKEIDSSCYECKFCKETHLGYGNLERHTKKAHFCRIKCAICFAEVTKKYYRHHLKGMHGVFKASLDKNDENENKCESVQKNEILRKSAGNKSKEDVADLCEVMSKEEREPVDDDDKTVLLYYTGVECKICNQIYSNDVNLKKHVYNVHRMVRVKCHVCSKEVNKKSFDRHMKNVHSAKIYYKKGRKSTPAEEKIACATCGKKCLSSMSLQNHIKTVHEAEQHKCTQCEFRGTQKHLDKHMKKEHNDEVYQCSRCLKILKSKSTLKEHMWIHTDHRRFICDICGMRFKRTSNYHGHMKSHQDKKFQCRICGNFFLRKRYLAVHEQTIHNYYGEGVPPQEKGYQCEICGVKLKWKNNLLAHMRIHTGEKPYKCKICSDEFTCHGSLRTHMAKHSICQAGQDESNLFIQRAYLGSKLALPPTSSALSSDAAAIDKR